MTVHQSATVLALGTAGIEVPNVVGSMTYSDTTFLLAKAEIPTLKAGALTFEVSRDGGVTKMPLLGFIALTGAEPTLTAGATAATFTGNQALFLGKFLPGTRIYAASATSQAAVAASITSDHTAALSNVTLTAKATGAAGNDITITYTVADAANESLVVSVSGTDITVALATDAGKAATSTSAQVETAINAHAGASALVTAAKEGAGSGVCNALAHAHLANGWTLPVINVYLGL
jgi:hypothetical protein